MAPEPAAEKQEMIRDYLRSAYRIAVPLLYSRSRFKLFLKGSIEGVAPDIQKLAFTTDYFASIVQPIAIKAPFGRSLLVIAPHQDDEAIGCGGALALQVRSGNKAAVAILQDGGDDHESLGLTRPAMVELRNEESRRCAAVLGIEPPRFLGYARLAETIPQAASEVREILRQRAIDLVFVPFVLDRHPDHWAANLILAAALREIPWDVRVLGYEVWGLCIPNVAVIIDGVIEEKIQMISCFESANKAVDYVASTKGLNMYHSRMFGAGESRYVERFFELPRAEYIELVERIRAS
jgi:N-acetylglucosamine malate deacetylase 1